MTKPVTPKIQQPTEYEKRVKAMTLATQHSKNCHSDTLVKIAERIYDFLNGKKSSKPQIPE